MQNIYININSYLKHIFNAQYLASQFINMFCTGTDTAEQCFRTGFVSKMAVNIRDALYRFVRPIPITDKYMLHMADNNNTFMFLKKKFIAFSLCKPEGQIAKYSKQIWMN